MWWARLLACAPEFAAPEVTGLGDGSPCVPLLWYPDGDADGFGDPAAPAVESCEAPSGTVANPGDCDDADAGRFPGNDDPCDGVDNNCDGTTDPTTSRGWRDADGDGAGDPAAPLEVCDLVTPAAPNAWDCDDADPAVPVFVEAGAAGGGTGSLLAPLPGLDEGLHTDARCVRLLPGVYSGSVTFRGVDVDVASTDGPDLTVLEGTDDAVVTFWSEESRATVLQGFTLRGGVGKQTYEEWSDGDIVYAVDITYGGGVVSTGASPTLRDLVIVDHLLPESTRDDGVTPVALSQSEGAAIFAEYGAPLLEDVYIRGNRATYGAALYAGFGSEVELRRVQVVENEAEHAAIYVGWGSIDAFNLVMNANRSSVAYDGILTFYGRASVTNSTLVDHAIALGTWGASDHEVVNTIVHGNGVGLSDDGKEVSTWLLAYDDIYGNTLDLGAIEAVDRNPVAADPRFRAFLADGDAAADDLGLAADSPCVDAGDPTRPDPDGSRSDVGATGGPDAG